MEVFSLFGSVTLSDEEVREGLKEIEEDAKTTEKGIGDLSDQTEKSSSSMIESVSSVAASFTKFAAAGAAAASAMGGALFLVANRVTDTGDEIDKTAMKLGIGTDALQEMRFAADQLGVSQGSMERAMGRLNQRMSEGNEESTKYTEALERLGVATRDAEGNHRDADLVFQDVIGTLGEVESSSDRAALAAEVFGTRTARELLPAIEAGGEELEELTARAHEVGSVMSEDNVAASAQFQDAIHEAQQILGVLWREITFRVLPTFQMFLNWIGENAGRIQAVFEFIGSVTAIVFRTIAMIISDAVVAIGENIITPFLGWLAEFWSEHQQWIARAASVAWNVITEVISTAVSVIGSVLSPLISLFGNLLLQQEIMIPLATSLIAAFLGFKAVSFLPTLIQGIVAAKTALAAIMATMLSPIGLVVAAIAGLTAAGVALYRNWDTVMEFADRLMEKVSELANSLRDRVVEIRDNVVGNITRMTSEVTESVSGMVDTIRENLVGRLDGIRERVTRITEGIGNAFGALRNAVTGNSHIPDMVDEIDEAWDKFQHDWENNGKMNLDSAENDFSSFGQNVEETNEDVVNDTNIAANQVAITWDSVASDIGNSIADITTGVAQGVSSWSDLIVEFGNIFVNVMQQAIAEFITALITSQSAQATWLASVVSTMASAAASFISAAYAGLVAFFSFLGPFAPAAAAGVIGVALAAIGKMAGKAISAVGGAISTPSADTDFDSDGETDGNGGGNGGQQISEITGPTRDLLTDLLRPLARFDELTGIGNRIYDLLDARLPKMGELAVASGAGDVNIGEINLTVPVDDASQIPRRVVDDLESELATRLLDERRGTGGR